MRSGCGSLSRILDWSVDGPRGAKLGEVGEVDRLGDAGRDAPLPSPDVLVSHQQLIRQLWAACRVPSRNSASGESSSITFSMTALPHCAGYRGGTVGRDARGVVPPAFEYEARWCDAEARLGGCVSCKSGKTQ
jgi:hypothetical protein